MQSIAPNIIKHFIPYEFSKNVLDMQVAPKKISASKKDENPLQNIKLRNLQKQAQRELVLTFKNKSNKLYRSKKSLNYQNLFRQLEEQQHKLNLIKEQIQAQKHRTIKQAQIIRVSLGNINQICLEENKQLQERGRHTFRKLHTQQMKRRATIYIRRQTADDETKRPQSHRLYSSINFKQYNQRIREDYSKHSQLYQSPFNRITNKSSVKLKVRGRQAPESEMIDHLRRSSTFSDIVISIDRFDKKR